ncbi:MAG: hypothetical protein MHPSP_004691, partial [Paramarteilia canceri]
FIAKNQRFSIIVDEWTSIANVRFTVVIIYMGEKVYNLGTSSVTGTSNSENLMEVLKAKLQEYNLNLDNCVTEVSLDFG